MGYIYYTAIIPYHQFPLYWQIAGAHRITIGSFSEGTFTGVSSGFCLQLVCVTRVKAAKTVKLCVCYCSFKHSKDLKLSSEETKMTGYLPRSG